MPILLNRRAVGALGVDLKFNAGPRLRALREVPRHRRVDHRAGGEDPAAGRGGQEAAGRREHAPAAGAEGALRLLEHHRHERSRAADVRADGAGGGHQHDRAHSRRVGHRQGADRARDPLQLAARQQAVRQGELRGAAGQPDRVRALRLRERARSPARSSARRGASSWPKAARCSSTRSATSTCPRR